MKTCTHLFAALLGAAPAFALRAPAQAPAQPALEFTTLTLEPAFEVVAHRVFAREGRPDVLILIGRKGEIESWRPSDKTPDEDKRIRIVLPEPERTLVDTASYGGRDFVVAASPAGVTAYALDGDLRVTSEAQTWIPRAKFQLRVLTPQLTSIVQDVNRDGAPDVVLPTPNACELWLASFDAADGAPKFRKTATLAVDVTRWGSREGEYLSDALESSFAIPGLDTSDVNGDGRPDLLVEQDQRRAFHLQREDGSFPVTPDIQVDLSIFRDTTEAGGFKLGAVLSATDRVSWSSRDLNRDGIPDYVIGHRRKVWVFRGGKQGPQFKDPAAILKTAEDITALMVLELDADEHPDLLLVKLQVPTLATLLRGLFGEWDVRVGALGYRNKGDATFETNPKWSNELTLRLPGIVGVFKNPEKFLERFTELEKRFRVSARGDVNGDGDLDVLVASEDRKRLDVWFGERGSGQDAGRDTRGERKMRQILFDDKNTAWDIDRLVAALGNLAQRQVALLTGERKPDWSVELRDPSKFELGALECADFDGDGRAEVLVGYRRGQGGGAVLFDVLAPR